VTLLLRSTEISLEQATSPRVRQFDTYWRSKMKDARLPRPDEIDPGEIKHLLPFVVLVDIEPDPFRVRYRLCGTMVSYYDEELTGKYLEDLQNTTPEAAASINDLYRTVVSERRPVFVRIPSHSRQTGNLLTLEGAIWPLSTDGQMVDKCAAIEDFPGLS
jgi:hypothetical protein